LNAVASTSMIIDIQLSVDNVSWSAWSTNVSPDSDLGATFDGSRYFKYRVNLDSSINPSISPRLDQFVLDFSNYPVGAGLVSSVFDTGDKGNYLQTISWTEALNNGDIRLQIATSSDNVNWNYCGSNACSTSDWLSWSNANNYYDSGNLAHAQSSDAVNDRYFKYKVWLISDGTGTQSIDNIITTYDSAGLHVLAPNGISSSYTATAGTAFNIVLKAKDSDGTGDVTDHGDMAPIAVRFTASSAQPDGTGCTSSFTDNGNTQFTQLVLLFTNGVVTIPNVMLCDAAVSDNFTISAQEIANGALSSTSDLTISSVDLASTTQLVFTTQPPTSALATVDFTTSPVVSIQDQIGNTILTETTAVTLQVWGDSLCNTVSVGGTLTLASLGTTNGVATFSNMSYSNPDAIFIKASASGFTDVCSDVVDVVGTGYVVQISPIYDVSAGALVATASLLRNGTLITDNANMSLFDFDILDDVGASVLAAGGYLTDPEVSVVTDTVNSVYHTTWTPGAGFIPDTAYQIVVTITYNGSQYQGNQQANINQLGVIAADLQALDTQLDTVQTTISGIETKAIVVDTSVLALDTKISAHAASQAAYRAQTTISLATIAANIGSILEDTSKTVPDLVKLTIAKELAKGSLTEIITTQAIVRTGTTIPFRYRTASGLTPLVTVLDPKEAGKIQNAPMKEISGTGIYVYDITFKTVWGLGNFMVSVNETTKNSVDRIVLKVVQDTEEAKKARGVVSSGVTIDTLYSRMNKINSSMDTLSYGITTVKSNTENVSTDISDLLNSLGGRKGVSATAAADAEKFAEYINSVSLIIGANESTTNHETIMGKLNGISKTLNGMGDEAKAAQDFNRDAKVKAERIKSFVTHIMAEVNEDGTIEDLQAKVEILDDYLIDLKTTVEGIPESVTTEAIAESVNNTLNELSAVIINEKGMKGLMPLVRQDLSDEVTDILRVEDLTPADVLKMRNDVSGLKSLMLEIENRYT